MWYNFLLDLLLINTRCIRGANVAELCTLAYSHVTNFSALASDSKTQATVMPYNLPCSTLSIRSAYGEETLSPFTLVEVTELKDTFTY